MKCLDYNRNVLNVWYILYYMTHYTQVFPNCNPCGKIVSFLTETAKFLYISPGML